MGRNPVPDTGCEVFVFVLDRESLSWSPVRVNTRLRKRSPANRFFPSRVADVSDNSLPESAFLYFSTLTGEQIRPAAFRLAQALGGIDPYRRLYRTPCPAVA